MNLDDVASLVLASAAAARAFAPDVKGGVRRLLGVSVRVGVATLIEKQQPAVCPEAARPSQGGRQ